MVAKVKHSFDAPAEAKVTRLGAGAARFGHLLRTPTPYLTDLLAVIGLASRVTAGG